ncbi:ectonucleoside triphosphate diphosphohydrolase 3 [Homo sapiens]|uniref:Ectonucleoside triphosphate diphosphohydrolase 3 n=1 Tax=Homo sapiens TaxID=9606 RepID=A0A3B3IT06_HUMAN|nr:ectonucleoside triphosphate diphosphohydrolase 3 [Homo sapiens]KAI4029045.1 ectonucleoside triphosphate diphosphohydrolase 3 [Homo sapiens]
MFTVLTRQPCEQAGLKALYRTPTIIALVVLLVSIVVLVSITVIQIHKQEVLPPGLKARALFTASHFSLTLSSEWRSQMEGRDWPQIREHFLLCTGWKVWYCAGCRVFKNHSLRVSMASRKRE